MEIDEVRREDFGTWECKVLRARRDGKSGSEAITESIQLFDGNRVRTSRLNSEDSLQGFTDGDEDVKLFMNITMDDAEAQSTDLYFIVQRQYTVKEGRESCPDLR